MPANDACALWAQDIIADNGLVNILRHTDKLIQNHFLFYFVYAVEGKSIIMQKTLNHYLRKFGIFALDIGCIFLSLLIAYLIYPQETVPMSNYMFALLLLSLIYNFVNSQNRYLFSRGYLEELKEVVFYNFYLLCGFIVMSFFTKRLESLSRLLTLYFIICDTLLMYVSRTAVKLILRNMYSKDDSKTKDILMVLEKGYENVEKQFECGLTYRIAGVLIFDGKNATGSINDTALECQIEELTSRIVTYKLDDVVLKLPNYDHKGLFELITDIEDMGVNCHYALDIPTGAEGNAKMDMFGDMFMATYTLRTQSAWKLCVKRLIDICGALVGLLLCGIISIFLVPAIKLDSPGPVIFSQIRIGKNGRRFKFYKFRSMYIDAEERKKEIMKDNEMNGLMFKMEDDPRITKVGKFIRKTSLDEFPQFFNVLIGDMSLVGTRPPTEDEFRKYNGHYKRRLMMTPGITGLWQVSGRSDITDFDEIVKLDLDYIDNWSLSGDIKILFRTVAQVIKREGAE